MAQATIEQLKKAREDGVETNRELGVVSTPDIAPKSDAVFEVEEGYLEVGTTRLGPGQRFNPTVRQLETGSLKGKARELTRSQYRDVGRTGKSFAGADLDSAKALRRIGLTDDAMKAALESGLTAEDFAGTVPEGAAGKFTKAQVRQLVEAKGEAKGMKAAA